MSKRLMYLVDEFPLDTCEHFPALECEYLCRAFDEVVIVPTNYRGNSRTPRYPLPKNATLITQVLDELKNNSLQRRSIRKKIFSSHVFSLAAELLQFPCKEWQDVIAFWGEGARIHDSLLKYVDPSSFDVLYCFWSGPIALAVSRFRKQNPKLVCVARAHGYDLFSERVGKKKLPFQKLVIARINRMFPCSKMGETYLKQKFGCYAHKISSAYLGVEGPNTLNAHLDDGRLRLVSCSAVTQVKRIPFLVDALSQVRRRVEWTHFGDGDKMPIVKEQIGRLPPNIRADMKGNVPNAAILEYYRKTPVDLLVNVSSAEGLPVSIMEAISFGIPCLGLAVGGIPEIINSDNGYLLPADSEPRDVASVLEQHELPASEMRKNARRTYLEKFQASKNFTAFCQELLQL